MGREMGGGSCFGTHVRIKDFKIKKKKGLQITNAEEGVEKREPSYAVRENVNWYSHYGDQ